MSLPRYRVNWSALTCLVVVALIIALALFLLFLLIIVLGVNLSYD